MDFPDGTDLATSLRTGEEGCIINPLLLSQLGDNIAMLRVLEAQSHNSVVSLQRVFHFFSHRAHLQSQTVSSCHFPFVLLVPMLFLSFRDWSCHKPSSFCLLVMFLKLFQPLSSAVSLVPLPKG